MTDIGIETQKSMRKVWIHGISRWLNGNTLTSYTEVLNDPADKKKRFINETIKNNNIEF